MSTVSELRVSLHLDLSTAVDKPAIEAVRVKYLGKKGLIKELLNQIKQIPESQKASFAASVNELKDEAESKIGERQKMVERSAREAAFKAQALDITLPGDFPARGTLHPITTAEDILLEVMRGLGFQVTYGPEVETEYYCFDAL